MKILLLIIVLIIGMSGNVTCQDVIYKYDGTEIKAKVIEIAETIKYRNFDQKDGPIRNLKKEEVFMIIYEDGTKEIVKNQLPVITDNDTVTKNSNVVPNNISKSGNGYSIINIYRPGRFVGIAIGIHIVINGKEVNNLMNGHKLRYKIYGTGPYEITCNEAGITSAKYFNTLTINVQKGKTYFVEINTGNIKKANKPGKHLFEEVDFELGKIQFEKLSDEKLIEISEHL